VGQQETNLISRGFAHRFRPTYAGANTVHPEGLVVRKQ
jgi:hypothetical protein